MVLYDKGNNAALNEFYFIIKLYHISSTLTVENLEK